jgi:hypothetical protein
MNIANSQSTAVTSRATRPWRDTPWCQPMARIRCVAHHEDHRTEVTPFGIRQHIHHEIDIEAPSHKALRRGAISCKVLESAMFSSAHAFEGFVRICLSGE